MISGRTPFTDVWLKRKDGAFFRTDVEMETHFRQAAENDDISGT